MTTQPVVAEPIRTARLLLVPLDPAAAQRILDDDLTGLSVGDGWPHLDTRDGVAGVLDGSAGWLVTLDGVIIGDCGTAGQVQPSGDVEIGYGLAAPYRGRRYGTELVAGLSPWLLAWPGVRRVLADVLVDNVPSRRALERAGFGTDGVARPSDEGDLLTYVLEPSQADR